MTFYNRVQMHLCRGLFYGQERTCQPTRAYTDISLCTESSRGLPQYLENLPIAPFIFQQQQQQQQQQQEQQGGEAWNYKIRYARSSYTSRLGCCVQKCLESDKKEKKENKLSWTKPGYLVRAMPGEKKRILFIYLS